MCNRNVTEKCDIMIIGAGPAGSTFARLIDSAKYKVVLVDGQTDKNSKPCGGLLAPDAQKILAEFDLSLPKDVLVDPQIFSVKTIDAQTGKIRYYPRFYMNMDRFSFDKWLLSLVPREVDVVNGKCTQINACGECFNVAVNTNMGKVNYVCKAVVGADGANSMVRRTFFPSYKTKSYVAIQQWFATDEMNPFYSCIFDPKTSPSCSWSIVKDSYFIFGGAFEACKCRENFEKQKKRMESFGFTFSEPIKTEACMVLRPTLKSGFCLGGGGVYLIGEAAGFISPSSFEGISSAIKSGTVLSEAINKSGLRAHKGYEHKTLHMRLRLLLKCIKHYFMYTPFFRKIIMNTGIQSIELKKQIHK